MSKAGGDLRARWALRDRRYGASRSDWLDARVLDAIQAWRIAEAAELEDPEERAYMLNRARNWTPPRLWT